MPRLTVKVLLVDPDDRLLLIHGRDPADGTHHWYPVGGGIESGETHHGAAAREAWEETGLEALPVGETVWTREARYRHAGASWDVERYAQLLVDGSLPVPIDITVDPTDR